MKIKLNKGKKCEGDKLIVINSKDEAINIFDIALIINQMSINELKIIDSKGYSREGYFWFANVIKKAIKDSENGIDWSNCSKENLLELVKNPYYINKKLIDKFFEEKDGKD